MKNAKKNKINKLNFYIIDDNYVSFLGQFDKHIAYNKNQKRPYIGVLIIVDNHRYFAPLFSPKPKHKTYKDNLTFFRINNSKNELGIIRFSDMIPVPQECVYLLNLKDKSYGYKRLLSEQYSYINKTNNRIKIIEKAEKLYSIVTTDSKSKMSKFYKDLSCDFKLLEEKSKEYNKMTTTLYLIRHSKQLKDYEHILTSESTQEQNEKIILSVEGEAEAKNLSKNKELEDISEVWSSSYVRAISTAKYIAERNSLKINIDISLNERRLRRFRRIKCIRRKVRPSVYNRTNT